MYVLYIYKYIYIILYLIRDCAMISRQWRTVSDGLQNINFSLLVIIWDNGVDNAEWKKIQLNAIKTTQLNSIRTII